MTDEFLSDDDLATWEYVSKSITPLSHRKPTAKNPATARPLGLHKIIDHGDILQIRDVLPTSKKLPHLTHGKIVDIDKSTAQRLLDGKFPIEAKLDMHGRTQEEAFDGLNYFIQTSYSMAKRCVLVVTGKGVEGEGILKQQAPRWLNDSGLREYIIMFAYAKPKHGGEGALYILLKRQRT